MCLLLQKDPNAVYKIEVDAICYWLLGVLTEIGDLSLRSYKGYSTWALLFVHLFFALTLTEILRSNKTG